MYIRSEKEIRLGRNAGIADLFLPATWFGQVFNLFPLGSREAYELLFLARRNGR